MLTNRMLVNQLRPIPDLLLCFSRNGFMQNRTTVGQILAFGWVKEGIQQNNLKAATFIDFKKFNDTIHVAKIMQI